MSHKHLPPNKNETILYLFSHLGHHEDCQQHQGWALSQGLLFDFSLNTTTATLKACLELFLKVCEPWRMVQLPWGSRTPQDLPRATYFQAGLSFG